MATDDWRVTVTPHDKGHVRRAAQFLREHEVTDDMRGRLGRRVAVSMDGPHVFLDTSTEDAAREADRVVREVLTQHEMLADIALDRWQPLKQEWVDAGAPVPEAAELRKAEHQRLIDEETRQSLAHGQAGWEVRVELPSHREAAAPIPAKLPASQVTPGARKAVLATRSRSLQMVLRLLAASAEHWLGNRLNDYLRDNNEYRAIARNLLHLGGIITCTPSAITVTLDPPPAPRIARALALLLDEINASPPRMPGDPRPITYQLATPAPI